MSPDMQCFKDVVRARDKLLNIEKVPMSFFPGDAISPDTQCFKDVVRAKDKLLYREVTFFPGEACQQMQYFKDVVRTKDKLLYREVTFFPGEDLSPDMQCCQDEIRIQIKQIKRWVAKAPPSQSRMS